MEQLKSSYKKIPKETEELIEEYVKLFKIKQSEKLALLLGILSSALVLCFLVIIVTILLAIGVSEFLNKLLGSGYLGYFAAAVIMVVVIVVFSLIIIRSQKPLLTNLFVKFMVSIFNLQISTSKNLKGLKSEVVKIEHEIEISKLKIKADFTSIRYAILDNIMKDFFGFFKSREKIFSSDNQKEEKSELEKKIPE